MFNELILDFKSILNSNQEVIKFKSIIKRDIYHYHLLDNYKERIKGNYYIIRNQKNDIDINYLYRKILKVLKIILKKYKAKKALIIGLGDSSILCDCLGIYTINKLLDNNKINDFYNSTNIIALNPEILNKTGIKSSFIIKDIIEKENPDVIITVSSLMTNNDAYLDRVIEVTDTGVISGYYLKDNKTINCKTFNIPIISIGVSLVLNIGKKSYTSWNNKDVITKYSSLIAKTLAELFIST